MKLPAMQFYPGDWHKDQGVQALDLMQRGAWFELLLMMHDSDERGVLLVNGQPMPDAVVARRLGLDNQTANQILTILLTYGVASRRESDGALYCRRMVRDERLRQIRQEAGRKGGNPRLLNQTDKQIPTTGDKQMPTPSFSSSLSPSGSEEGAADAAPPAKPVRKLSGATKLPSRGQGRAAPASEAKRRPAAPPVLSEVQAYAAEQYPASSEAQTEAAAFHDHFQSNGWRVGGKTPMVDWQAAFRGWMRRRANFQPATAAPNATPSRARTSPKPPDPDRWR
ncbi:hypothetical protein [Hymenobacter jeollabukensis]|uniref:Uncharacterized protein n=1 Tax=Hymenobacter jeollabukensis TaxID=2025313 RepID=A0A5R8WK21_9BACT|nr:hypothetical protein [Hymenobacter jeollabukensis]TLM89372.1 hypothetical protein FDY95_20070 [Hymenobacter jeollabukensis]